MRIDLPYVAPLDWAALSGFLEARATPRVERVQDGIYERVLDVAGETVMVRVSPHQPRAVLWLDVETAGHATSEVAARARRVFDLDCDPAAIDRALSTDPLLTAPLRAHPGIRVPGAWDPFELCVRAVLGQQITVKAASTLIVGAVASPPTG
jgi:3-methyladenine DNA glycosylase/8-oxoguanine DNA glycosylase